MKQTKYMSQKYPKHETEKYKNPQVSDNKKQLFFWSCGEGRQYNLKLINTASFKMYMLSVTRAYANIYDSTGLYCNS